MAGGTTAQGCPAALLLALLLPLAICRPAPTVSAQSIFDQVWSNYTNTPNSFNLGPALVGATTADSDGACAQQCNQLADCLWWAWCPAGSMPTCQVLSYCNVTRMDATTGSLPAGTCLLSGEAVQGRVASSIMQGAGVAWSSGYYAPSGAAATEPSSLTASGSVSDRALVNEAQFEPSTNPVWRTFTNQNNTFYRGPNLAGNGTFESREACAMACSDDPLCQLWTWCPSDTAEGCEALNLCEGRTNSTQLPPGTCLLSYDEQQASINEPRIAFLHMTGAIVAWSGGYLSSAAPAPAPEPGLSPDLSPSLSSSLSPDLSPSLSPVLSPSLSPAPSPTPSGPTGDDCPEGFKKCSGTCIEVKSNKVNCGFCGHMCGGETTCMAGMCMCSIGQRDCGGTCANILMDTHNCGSCGWSCSFGQQCFGGVCS